MKIVCVAGGSYKSFYINYAVKLKKCDLLIFNFGILYDYYIKDKLIENHVLTNELIFLSNKLDCVIVAGIYVIDNEKKFKAIIKYDKGKIDLYSPKFGAEISVNTHKFIVGDRNTNYLKFDKIVLSNERLIINPKNCSRKKIYVFFDRHGVNFIINKKIKRKFCKYSKIILK